MLIAAFFFALMGFLVKLEGTDYSSTELMFYRSLTGFILIFFVAFTLPGGLITRYWRLHIQRSVCGIISLWLYFYGITHLPLATAVTLNYTSPLFLALIMVGVLKEKARPSLIAALSLGFIGVALVLKPHLGPDQWLAGLAGLLSGFFAGLVFLNVRAMGEVNEPEWRIVLYFTFLSTLVSGLMLCVSYFNSTMGIPSNWIPDAPHRLRMNQIPLLLAIGVSALLGQLCMTRAYKTGAVWLTSNFAYFTIVFSSLFGVVFHSEWLSVMAWIGIAVIISAGGLATWARKNGIDHE
jgi:drug/metabolite transporter (DMT)-like permease